MFIGGGNMASALAAGLLAGGSPARSVALVEPFQAQRTALATRLPGVQVAATPSEALLRAAGIVVLAVKPQQMREACESIAPWVAKVPVVLSIAAGTRIEQIVAWLGGASNVARAMPNTPAMVGAGITGVFASEGVAEKGRDAIAKVLSAAGEIVWCPSEERLDAVTGVSGSGPAYVFYCLEALEAAARDVGFAPGDARKLAYATFDGAIRLARASDADPATLRAQVTSKGGTTERGVAVLVTREVKQAFLEAVRAATQRARELGEVNADASARRERS